MKTIKTISSKELEVLIKENCGITIKDVKLHIFINTDGIAMPLWMYGNAETNEKLSIRAFQSHLIIENMNFVFNRELEDGSFFMAEATFFKVSVTRDEISFKKVEYLENVFEALEVARCYNHFDSFLYDCVKVQSNRKILIGYQFQDAEKQEVRRFVPVSAIDMLAFFEECGLEFEITDETTSIPEIDDSFIINGNKCATLVEFIEGGNSFEVNPSIINFNKKSYGN